MENQFQVFEDKKNIDQLMLTYFSAINGDDFKKALSFFKHHKGYGIEFVFVSFKFDLDEYDMMQLPKALDEKHVLIELCYPVVEVNQLAYLDFKTFYAYLVENVRKESEKNIENVELIELLEEVKCSLHI